MLFDRFPLSHGWQHLEKTHNLFTPFLQSIWRFSSVCRPAECPFHTKTPYLQSYKSLVGPETPLYGQAPTCGQDGFLLKSFSFFLVGAVSSFFFVWGFVSFFFGWDSLVMGQTWWFSILKGGGAWKWVCLKIGYVPNYSHLIGIMISKTIGFRGTLFSDIPK